MSAETIWLVGCGNMGGAMLERWLDTGLDPASVTVIDPAMPTLRAGVTVRAVPDDQALPPAIVMLCVKPQLLDVVTDVIAPRLNANTVLLSIMAGVTIAALRARFALPHAILRAMPNLPVVIGEGVVALYGADRQGPVAAKLDALMASLGLVEWLADEAMFDAVTAVSGSGPAFVYRFIGAFTRGGVALGLPADQAARMAAATVAGAGELARQSGDDPLAMAERVTSKGGTTERGLAVLDAGDALDTLITATLVATAERSAELGELSAHPRVAAP